MQKFLPFLTILALFAALPVLADVPVPSNAVVRWYSEGTAPLASRYIPQLIVQPGRASLSLRPDSRQRVVVPAPGNRTDNRFLTK
ncbi:MAG: hypothetical protein H7Y12_14965 [Sphingobacteriaceae bacterium]|nr:hypothetical protein [Cytophagaceae bacterium]